MGKKCALTAQERREIVLQMIRKERPVSAIGREYNVSDATLYKWQEQFLEAGLSGLERGGSSQESSTERAEIARLNAEVHELKICLGEYTVANKILKKIADRSPLRQS